MSLGVHINEVIKIANLGSGDLKQRSKGRMLSYAKYIWEDMEMTTIKLAVRERFQINKRTNTVKLPHNSIQLSSVNVMDRHTGIFYPVFRNDNAKCSDIVDIGAAKDCACEHSCSYRLCNTIKGYEAITSVKSDFLPDSTPISFTCVDRKCVNDSGEFISETQYPLRVYHSGVWVDTVLHTETKELCKLEVDDKGCVCDTEHNINACCHACGIDNIIPYGGTADTPPGNTDSWIYYCDSKMDWFSTQCGYGRFGGHFNNVYNISELGDTLIFPHNFGFDEVMIRYYIDVNLQDLYVPRIAVNTFIMGLKWWDCQFNDKKQELAAIYGHKYSIMKFGLIMELNKYRISELRMIITPPVFVPGTIGARHWGNEYGFIE